MRILVADKLPEEARETLADMGHEVDFQPGASAGDLPALLAESGAHILVVRSTKVQTAAIEGAPSLSLIIRAGAGVNTIDLETASRRGVFVANCPGKNAIAVAELTMGLLLALDRHIPEAAAKLQEGTWDKKRFGRASGVHGRRMGLVGFGSIAREVASRAQAFGISVAAWTPNFTDLRAATFGVGRFSSLDDLLRESDIVSVHVPHVDTTHHLIGTKELGLMKQGSLFLHTSRGGVVDDDALRQAVEAGRIRAGVDVFEGEPGAGHAPFENALAKTDGVIGTPHIGASTAQASNATADEVIRIVRDFVELGLVHNAVNLVTDRPGTHAIVVRHLDRVGVLAGVLQALRSAKLNVKEMQNVIFEGNQAACATITMEHQPSATVLAELRSHESVIAVDTRSTG